MGEALAAYHEHQDLINLGAYEQGSNAQVDRAIALRPQLLQFLRQDSDDCASFEHTREALAEALASPPSPSVTPAAELPAEPSSRRPNLPHALASFRAAATAGAEDRDAKLSDNPRTDG